MERLSFECITDVNCSFDNRMDTAFAVSILILNRNFSKDKELANTKC